MDRLLSRKLIIAVSLLVIVLFALIYILVPADKAPGNEVDTSSGSQKMAGQVYVKDFHKYDSSIDKETRGYIQNMLHTSVGEEKRDLYTGVIRPNSYSNKVSNGLRVISLTVDVEPARMTYLVSIRKSEKTRSLNVICAPKEMQMDPSVKCTEMEWQ